MAVVEELQDQQQKDLQLEENECHSEVKTIILKCVQYSTSSTFNVITFLVNNGINSKC